MTQSQLHNLSINALIVNPVEPAPQAQPAKYRRVPFMTGGAKGEIEHRPRFDQKRSKQLRLRHQDAQAIAIRLAHDLRWRLAVLEEARRHVQKQNILRFEELLGQVTDPMQRKQIENLIAAEKAKSKPSGA